MTVHSQQESPTLINKFQKTPNLLFFVYALEQRRSPFKPALSK